MLATPTDLVKARIIENMVTRRGIILDVGCGVGLCTRHLTKFGRVIGLDVSKRKISVAKNNNKDTSFILADGQLLPFRSTQFDIIIAKDVLEHIIDDWRLLQEAYRVSNDHAEIILFVPFSLARSISIEALVFKLTGCNIDKVAGHLRRYTVRHVISMLETSGFRVTQKSFFGHITTSLPIVLLNIGYRAFKKKELSGSPLLEVVLELLVPMFMLEYRILERLPGAGLFVSAEKLR